MIEFKYSISEVGKSSPKYLIDAETDKINSFASLATFTKNALIAVSQEVLREELGKGFDKYHLTVVDRNPMKRDIHTVNPFGQIEFIARGNFKEFAMELYSHIIDRSHVKSGLYKNHNLVFYNADMVAKNKDELKNWLDNLKSIKMGAQLRFLNSTPYARRLEKLGVTKGNGSFFTAQKRTERYSKRHKVTYNVPNGVYNLAYLAIKKKYKNNSFIKFRMESGDKLGITSPIAPQLGRTFRHRFVKDKRPYVYPAIIVYLNEGGFTV